MKLKHICSYSVNKTTNILSLRITDLNTVGFNIKSAQYNVLPNLHIAQKRNFIATSDLEVKEKSLTLT